MSEPPKAHQSMTALRVCARIVLVLFGLSLVLIGLLVAMPVAAGVLSEPSACFGGRFFEGHVPCSVPFFIFLIGLLISSLGILLLWYLTPARRTGD